MNDDQRDMPRVFISYSWTNDDHMEWVAELGTRLSSDGIDVVLDQWSLEDGNDVTAFMELMVSDPTIKRVIIVCDALYAEKADGRKGGVGTETQIISKEVYDRVDQNKFIPLLREVDDEGNPCLPVFLQNRKYIDFSSPDKAANRYDDLIRNIFERPRRRKPPIGKAPSHIFEDELIVVTSAQKSKRFREIVQSGRGNPSVAFEDFVEEFFSDFEELRIAYKREQEESWCQTIMENIERAHAHRDVVVDVLGTGIRHIREDWFRDELVRFLERLLAYGNRPNETGAFFKCSEDNYKLLIYEIFLYSVASLISARRFADLRFLLDHTYVTTETVNGQRLESDSFTRFNNHADSLEGECAKRGNSRRLSVMADLIHDRADRTDVRFSELLQADVICCLAAASDAYTSGWDPRTLVYSGDVGMIELFARATTESGFAPLKQLLRVDSPEALLRSPIIAKLLGGWPGRDRFNTGFVLELLNLRMLKQVWLDED